MKQLPWFLKEWGQLDRAAFPPPAHGRFWLHSAAASDRPSEQKAASPVRFNGDLYKYTLFLPDSVQPPTC